MWKLEEDQEIRCSDAPGHMLGAAIIGINVIVAGASVTCRLAWLSSMVPSNRAKA